MASTRGATGYLDRVRVVLVRPRRGGNVGSVARAMKNMGLSDLALVAPRTPVGSVGARMAAHADDVLSGRRTFPTLAAAVSDCSLVVGTVGRTAGPRDPSRPARELAPEIVRAAGEGRVALVFGPEDHGLSNEELDVCQRQVRIPTAGTYASLNLAQAVLICAYEVLLGGADPAEFEAVGQPVRGPRKRARADRDAAVATSGEREAMLQHLGEALEAAGFLSRENPQHIMRDIRSLFARADLRWRDVTIWRGIARQVLWAVGANKGGPGPDRS